MTAQIKYLTRDNIAAELRRPQFGDDVQVELVVRGIIDDVAARGDSAVLEYTKKFDGVDLTPGRLRVGPDELEQALAVVPDAVIKSLRLAADRIKEFHIRQLPRSWMVETEGVKIGQKLSAIERVGLYAPGGLASYPSSVLMNAIPAQIAGVCEIALAVPPDSEGKVNPYVLAAASVAGVDEIYRMGGAQAIAAFAYGTEMVPRVYKITGPGNIYVATAKKLVFGRVDIDMIAGPTEIAIIADAGARADFIAADMIAQAEHDTKASAIALTDDPALAEAVAAELDRRLEAAPRADIARGSLADNGRIYIVSDLDIAIDFVNELAPEHLEIMTENAPELITSIRNAGAIFVGDYTPEALGDYVAGSNHVLPTSATARFFSPLGVYDFVKWSSVIDFSREATIRLGEDAIRLAEVEGLDGHARSVELRLKNVVQRKSDDEED